MSDHAALTREEQEFAAEHCGLIDLHLKVNGLDPDKWWDVLVFGYLTAVRCWFRVPQVRRWAFPTIAKVKMRGAMGNQLRYENRAMRRGQTPIWTVWRPSRSMTCCPAAAVPRNRPFSRC